MHLSFISLFLSSFTRWMFLKIYKSVPQFNKRFAFIYKMFSLRKSVREKYLFNDQFFCPILILKFYEAFYQLAISLFKIFLKAFLCFTYLFFFHLVAYNVVTRDIVLKFPWLAVSITYFWGRVVSTSLNLHPVGPGLFTGCDLPIDDCRSLLFPSAWIFYLDKLPVFDSSKPPTR